MHQIRSLLTLLQVVLTVVSDLVQQFAQRLALEVGRAIHHHFALIRRKFPGGSAVAPHGILLRLAIRLFTFQDEAARLGKKPGELHLIVKRRAVGMLQQA